MAHARRPGLSESGIAIALDETVSSYRDLQKSDFYVFFTLFVT